MIFGFNTDVKHADTVYHVQTEARAGERLIETQVFVRGRCVGKHAAPFRGGAAERQLHEQLQEQHRRVVDAIRTGRIDDLLRPKSAPALTLDWLAAEPQPAANSILLRFRLTAAGSPAAGARILARFDGAGIPSSYAEGRTAADGTVEIRLPFDPTTPDANLIVGATHMGVSLTQRFRLRRK